MKKIIYILVSIIVISAIAYFFMNYQSSKTPVLPYQKNLDTTDLTPIQKGSDVMTSGYSGTK